MAFDTLRPIAKDYITQLTSNVLAGTHTTEVARYSEDISNPHQRIVQKSAGEAPDHIIIMEGYSAGDAFSMLNAQKLLKGEWIDPDTWKGEIQPSALDEAKKGA